MSARFEDPPMTVAAFLDWERRQADRHEFIGGAVRPMTGGTASHSRLVRNRGNRLEVPALGLSLPLAVLYDRVIPAETASS